MHSVGIPVGHKTTLLVSAYDGNVGYGSFLVEFVATSSLVCEVTLGFQWLACFHALNPHGASTPGKLSVSDSQPFSLLYKDMACFLNLFGDPAGASGNCC